MAKLPPYFNLQFFDNNGDPLAGGKIYTYDNGTTTPKTTFEDVDEAAANTNPIILDANGRADIYLDDGSYTFRVDTSEDVMLYTIDDITGDVANAFGSSVQAISSNTSITVAQQNSVLICTSSPTLSLLSVTTAGEGFVFTVNNYGSGTVTIDPNASETINGASTITLAPGEWAIVVCDGDEWFANIRGILDNEVTTAKIVDEAVTNAKLADMVEATFKMRAAGAGTGVPIDGTATQLRAAADVYSTNEVDALVDAVSITMYTSGLLTVNVNDDHTLTHGLGAKPDFYDFRLINQTAEFGFSIGDEYILPATSDAGSSRAFSAYLPNDTNIEIRLGASSISIIDANNVARNITTANWRLVVRAFKI